MENENKEVELVTEPRVESRFGFQQTSKHLSSSTIKLFMIASAISLGAVLCLRSPDKPDIESVQEIKTPESGELGAKLAEFFVETYSAVKDEDQVKDKNKKKTAKIITKLPGLQKIDRVSISQIPPGTELKARLVTGASNGLVRAEVLENLKVQGDTLIKAGEMLIGLGQSSDERLLIQFTQIVRRDGSKSAILAQAADSEDRTVGLKGSKFKRYALRYGTAVGLNFVGGMTEGLQDRTIAGQNVVSKPSARNALLNGASRAAIEMANDTMENLKNQPPPISVETGKEIIVVFE